MSLRVLGAGPLGVWSGFPPRLVVNILEPRLGRTFANVVRTGSNDSERRSTPNVVRTVVWSAPIQMYGGGVAEAKIDLDLRTPNDRSN